MSPKMSFSTRYPATPLREVTFTTSYPPRPPRPQTPPTTPLAQISPPPFIASISPTIGMEGWLTLDDLHAQEKLKYQEMKVAESTQNVYYRNHQHPSQSSLSPIASYLSAMPSPLPVFKNVTTLSAVAPSFPSSSPLKATQSVDPSSSSSTSPSALSSTSTPSSMSSSMVSPSSSISSSSPSHSSISVPSSVLDGVLISSSLVSHSPSSSSSRSPSPSSVLHTPAVSSSSFVTSTSTPSSVPDSPSLPTSTLNPSSSSFSSSFSSELINSMDKPLQRLPTSSSSSSLSSEMTSSYTQSSAVTPGPTALGNNRSRLIRRAAVGMVALNSMALASAMPLEDEVNSPDAVSADPFSRTLSTNVFGFETILTGLVYLSFGIFLYQMIQRAVEAKIMEMPFNSAGGRSSREEGFGEESIERYFTSLLRALEQVPNAASELALEGAKAWEVKEKAPNCLPLYLCRLNYFYRHRQHQLNSTFPFTSASDTANFITTQPKAIFTSALSSVLSLWVGQKPIDLFMATWTGALGLPCVSETAACSEVTNEHPQSTIPVTPFQKSLLQTKKNKYFPFKAPNILDNETR